MNLAVINTKGEDTGRVVSLDESIFGIEPNEHAVYLDVKSYLANQRQGTAKTKDKGEICASTKKIKKQKGTGTARAGSVKSGVMRGGGTFFGPKPRDYSFKLNKKVKKLARKSVLSSRVKENNLKVIEDFSFESPKTKDFAGILTSLKIDGTKSLFLISEANKNVFLSSRNIKKANVLSVDQLNTYDLINAEHIILCESTLEQLNNGFN